MVSGRKFSFFEVRGELGSRKVFHFCRESGGKGYGCMVEGSKRDRKRFFGMWKKEVGSSTTVLVG